MSQTSEERLYHLLPAIYRLRDQVQGEPLRALMAGLESEFRIVEADIDALYDNWFIETCDEWVIPYLAGQIGVYDSDDTRKLFASQRRQVANTLGYRRRKGTTAVLEHVIQDVTGWGVRVLEYSQLLSITQHLRNVRTDSAGFVDLRHSTELTMLDGPFETTAHTIDIRHIGSGPAGELQNGSVSQGKYQPGNVGIFLWRLQSYLMTNVPARAVAKDAEHVLPAGCFTFDPLGRDMPLFSQPQALPALTQRINAVNLPGPISRVAFANDLKAYKPRHRNTTSSDELSEEEYPSQNSAYYGPDRSLCVILNGKPLPPNSVISADLSQWTLSFQDTYQGRESLVAIDVTLGRMLFLGKQPLSDKDKVEVNYCYGFSGDLGGGPYTRYLSPARSQVYRINVLKGGKVDTLQKALAQWEAYCRDSETDNTKRDRLRCTIHIVDNGLYTESDLVINLPKNSELVIEATNGVRPAIHGTMLVNGQHASAHLQLNGLLIDGKLDINGSLNLEIAHCTLMPHGLEASHGTPNVAPLQITIDHSIVGPIQLPHRRSELVIRDSIVDHASGYAIEATQARNHAGSWAQLERVTIFGKVQVQELRVAQDVIFTEPVVVKNQQAGLVSFSYVPEQSQTPRRERCQPDVAVNQSVGESASGDNDELLQDGQQVYPLFTSSRYGDPAYAQLDIRSAPQILRGASDGAEMGAFNSLRQVQREDNLDHILEEYLPFGMAAGTFYVT